MRRACPWDEADRREGVQVRLTLLPDECGGAVLERRPSAAWILVDVLRPPNEQRCLLAHELVHLDRGSMRCAGMPSPWDGVIALEEQRVDEEVADWLVPGHDLWVVVGDMVAAGQDVTRRVIAEEFSVTKHVAGIALERLARVPGLTLAS